jgi:hypothetical protein
VLADILEFWVHLLPFYEKKGDTDILNPKNGPCPWFCTRNFKTLIGWQKQGINILEQEFSSVF